MADGCNYTQCVSHMEELILSSRRRSILKVEKFLISRFCGHHSSDQSDVDAGDDGEGERVDEEEEALEAGGHQDPVLHDARLLRVGEAAFRGGFATSSKVNSYSVLKIFEGNNGSLLFRVVQLNFTPEVEVSYMMFERSLSNFSMTSLKQHRQGDSSP